ncbi:MAG: oxygenase MpaB family protein, partial [Verrucomicrobiota bacterium]
MTTPVTDEMIEESLQKVAAMSTNPIAGLFGMESKMWELGKYNVGFLGSYRAVLLQIAHPWVANAVIQHSKFFDEPLKRFHQTFHIVFGLTWGSVDQALAMARRLHRMHTMIQGPMPETEGVFDEASLYQANEAGALLWVHATLWETYVKIFELAVRPLGEEEKEQF